MTSEQLFLAAFKLHPCRMCPRIANAGAIAGAAYPGNPTSFEEALIEALANYRRETPKNARASRCPYPRTCGLPDNQNVTCFLRRERATPISKSALASV